MAAGCSRCPQPRGGGAQARLCCGGPGGVGQGCCRSALPSPGRSTGTGSGAGCRGRPSGRAINVKTPAFCQRSGGEQPRVPAPSLTQRQLRGARGRGRDPAAGRVWEPPSCGNRARSRRPRRGGRLCRRLPRPVPVPVAVAVAVAVAQLHLLAARRLRTPPAAAAPPAAEARVADTRGSGAALYSPRPPPVPEPAAPSWALPPPGAARQRRAPAVPHRPPPAGGRAGPAAFPSRGGRAAAPPRVPAAGGFPSLPGPRGRAGGAGPGCAPVSAPRPHSPSCSEMRLSLPSSWATGWPPSRVSCTGKMSSPSSLGSCRSISRGTPASTCFGTRRLRSVWTRQ